MTESMAADKTRLNPTTQAACFQFREDYLLFGLLVRHGVLRPGDHRQLVYAQQRLNEPAPLAEILMEASDFQPSAKREIQELLRILGDQKLRDYLPASIPEVDTIIQRAATTVYASVPSVDLDAETVQSESPPTTRSDSKFNLETLSSVLTLDEIDRVKRARVKSNLIGESLHGHVVLDRIGSGGQGDVYLAKQMALNRYVALKKLNVPHGAPVDHFVEAFRKEAQTLAAINHSNIVKIFDIFQTGSEAFFTMEYISGSTLDDLTERSGGRLPVDVTANAACQACSALTRTSSDGLIHRDIKPGNMMLDENGDLKIVDFGIAEAISRLSRSMQGFAGTPQYASPEQLAQAPLTAASDQWSLGATLYRVLTGEPPYKARTLEKLIDERNSSEPRPPSTINESLSSRTDRTIMKMLARNPSDRFKNFDECYTAWAKILAESQSHSSASVQFPETMPLLGESLRRIGKNERDQILKQGVVLAAVWLAMAAGAIFGEYYLRGSGLDWIMEFCGTAGTVIMVFSLGCIVYVAAARRGWLPILGSLRLWLHTHIATIIPAILMLMAHSGNFLRGIAPGPPQAKPLLSIIISFALILTAVSGTAGLLIYRTLRRQVALGELKMRGSGMSEREINAAVLGAQLLSGWRLVHYPLALLLMILSALHILAAIRFGWG